MTVASGRTPVRCSRQNFFHAVGLEHGILPDTLAVAQAAVFMPLATLLAYAADRKLRSPPTTFRYSAPAAVVLLGATAFSAEVERRRRWTECDGLGSSIDM